MNAIEHKKEFDKIIEKYNFNEEGKAEELAAYLTKQHGKIISTKEFSTLFAITEDEAKTFLSFIEKGIKFKENNLS